MALKLVFLGRLEDAAGSPEMEVPVQAMLDDVLGALEPALANVLRNGKVKVAINGVIFTNQDAPVLKDGDELAFLPPVSGG